MEAPPEKIDGARVLYYSPVDTRHTPTGNNIHRVDEEVLGVAVALAICQYDGDSQFYLFYCDEVWETMTDTCHSSLSEAMEQAEFEYVGISQTWEKVLPPQHLQ